jgi:PadR family transcriptional regulator
MSGSGQQSAQRGQAQGWTEARLDRTALDTPEGTIYPALHRLEERGWVASSWTQVSGREPARFPGTPAARFGPPAAAARGLPAVAAYRVLLAQITETALLVISALLLAVGAAAVPTAILAMAGNPGLATGDASRVLAQQDLQDVLRNHLLTGWLGFLVLVAWWLLHVHRKTQPALLPAGFTLTVCSTWLGVVAAFLLAFGIADVARGIDSAGGLIGSGDLLATGATVMAAALLSGVALARQAARPARNLSADPHP